MWTRRASGTRSGPDPPWEGALLGVILEYDQDWSRSVLFARLGGINLLQQVVLIFVTAVVGGRRRDVEIRRHSTAARGPSSRCDLSGD